MVKKKKRKANLSEMISNRLNVLFLTVVLLFSLLIFRLAQMQLLDKEFYLQKLEAKQVYTISTSNPRGQIYDAAGRPLVETKLKEVLAYTRSNMDTAEDIKELAKNLAQYVALPGSQVSRREMIDYYLADTQNYRAVVATLDDDLRYDALGNPLSESIVYQNAVDSVTDEMIAYSSDEKKIIGLFSQMNATATFDTVSLLTEDLTAEQLARVSANNQELASITVRTDWDRSYLDTSLSSLLGRISSSKTGLPAEEAEEYLAKGYSLNDRVGISYLEKTYEDLLQGEKTVRQITVGKDGSIIKAEELAAGNIGKHLQLTVNLDFQEGVENILESYFQEELTNGHAAYSQGVYAVAIEPDTGAILAMAGIEQENGELVKDALGTLTKVFTPGSVVKGATLATGWQNGVLSGNQVLTDQPIQFASSSPINSWFTTGGLNISATQSLEYSSNTYMVQIALKLMGQDYFSGMTLVDTGYEEAMAHLRETFAEFGMGVATGIDLPGESTGYVPTEFSINDVLTQSFGQYDNYTTLQLAQYVATVANGGRRLAPHLVKGIYQSDDVNDLGNLIEEIESREMNRVSLSDEELGLLQQGFYDVVHGYGAYTTGGAIANGAMVDISAKTGTAESYFLTESGQSVYTSNLNVVAYAPSANPKIAVAVVFPNNTDLWGSVSHRITRDIINFYQTINPMS